MRQSVIFIVSLLLVISNAKAQFINEFGIKSGFSASNVEWSGDYGPDTEQRYGTSMLIFSNFASQKHWSFSTNLGYIQKGCLMHEVMRDVYGNVIVDETEIHSLDFIHISTTINFFYKFDSLKPTVSIGPSAEYLAFHNGIYEYYEKDAVKSLHYNADVSFSLLYEFDTFISYFQFANQFELAPIIVTDNFDIKSRSFSVSLGIGIKI